MLTQNVTIEIPSKLLGMCIDPFYKYVAFIEQLIAIQSVYLASSSQQHNPLAAGKYGTQIFHPLSRNPIWDEVIKVYLLRRGVTKAWIGSAQYSRASVDYYS